MKTVDGVLVDERRQEGEGKYFSFSYNISCWNGSFKEVRCVIMWIDSYDGGTGWTEKENIKKMLLPAQVGRI